MKEECRKIIILKKSLRSLWTVNFGFYIGLCRTRISIESTKKMQIKQYNNFFLRNEVIEYKLEEHEKRYNIKK